MFVVSYLFLIIFWKNINLKFLHTFPEQVEVVIEYDLFTLCLLHPLLNTEVKYANYDTPFLRDFQV
jgi:hypothetical protein